MKPIITMYPEEAEAFYRQHFFDDDSADARRLNTYRAEQIYTDISSEFATLVCDLSYGVCIDFDRLEQLGKEVWLARWYYQQFKAKEKQI